MRPELWQCSGKLAVLPRSFYGSNAGKQRVQNTSKPSSSLRLLGPLRAPSFVRNRSWNTHVYRKTRKIAVERGGGYPYFTLAAMPTAYPLVEQDLRGGRRRSARRRSRRKPGGETGAAVILYRALARFTAGRPGRGSSNIMPRSRRVASS